MKIIQKNRYLLLILNILIISISFSQNNETGLDAINQELNKYRIKILEEDLKISDGIITINIYARRTNYSSLSLIAFYAVGKVYSGNNHNINEILISIKINRYKIEKITKKANYQDVQDLIMGRITQSEFIYKVRTS